MEIRIQFENNPYALNVKIIAVLSAISKLSKVLSKSHKIVLIMFYAVII